MTLPKKIHVCDKCIHFDPVPWNFSEWPCSVGHRPKQNAEYALRAGISWCWTKRGCKDFESTEPAEEVL